MREKFLTLHPADLRGLGQTVGIDLETQRTGLFGQTDFNTVFRADIEEARKFRRHILGICYARACWKLRRPVSVENPGRRKNSDA